MYVLQEEDKFSVSKFLLQKILFFSILLTVYLKLNKLLGKIILFISDIEKIFLRKDVYKRQVYSGPGHCMIIIHNL